MQKVDVSPFGRGIDRDMKIVCSICKKIIGEQRPYKDLSETKATCTDCIEKAKERAARFVPDPPAKDGQEIVLENGMKGVLSISKKGSSDLSFWELGVSGKRFFCAKETREGFQRYMDKVPGEEVDITFFHSATIHLDPSMRGRRKKNAPEKPAVEKNKSTHYNCTIKAPKEYALRMFDGMTERMENIAEILARSAYDAEMKDRQEKAAKAVSQGDVLA